jgi:succinate dehydrogenase/fumarate reductase-like Fe-S protein
MRTGCATQRHGAKTGMPWSVLPRTSSIISSRRFRMSDAITALVFRYDSDGDAEPRNQEYRVPTEEETTVLILLNRIHRGMDQTLSFRSFCCGLQMRRSCVMRIDDKKKFACLTLLRSGQKVTLEPVTFSAAHIKDLVAEMKGKGDVSLPPRP